MPPVPSAFIPALDDKILTAWNGMMLASLAEAARVLDRADYQTAAVKNAEFLLANMKSPDGRLLRTHKSGVTNPRIKATLEDYGCLIDGLLELYQTTFDERWFVEARALADSALEHFAAQDGGFFDTATTTKPSSPARATCRITPFPPATP